MAQAMPELGEGIWNVPTNGSSSPGGNFWSLKKGFCKPPKITIK